MMEWNDYVTGRLKSLWPRFSASNIADILNEETGNAGFTRNAIMGKVHRLRALGELPAKKNNKVRLTPAA